MQNPKTTIAGYILIVSSLLTLVSHYITGDFSMLDLQNLMSALAGVGLIMAKDGGV